MSIHVTTGSSEVGRIKYFISVYNFIETISFVELSQESEAFKIKKKIFDYK